MPWAKEDLTIRICLSFFYTIHFWRHFRSNYSQNIFIDGAEKKDLFIGIEFKQLAAIVSLWVTKSFLGPRHYKVSTLLCMADNAQWGSYLAFSWPKLRIFIADYFHFMDIWSYRMEFVHFDS